MRSTCTIVVAGALLGAGCAGAHPAEAALRHVLTRLHEGDTAVLGRMTAGPIGRVVQAMLPAQEHMTDVMRRLRAGVESRFGAEAVTDLVPVPPFAPDSMGLFRGLTGSRDADPNTVRITIERGESPDRVVARVRRQPTRGSGPPIHMVRQDGRWWLEIPKAKLASAPPPMHHFADKPEDMLAFVDLVDAMATAWEPVIAEIEAGKHASAASVRKALFVRMVPLAPKMMAIRRLFEPGPARPR